METVMQNIRTENNLVKKVIKRSAIIAMIIGSALTVINQTDAIFGNAEFQFGRMALAFLTPFLVVSVSQVFGISAACKAVSQNTGKHLGFFMTLFSHGILVRSVVMGLIAGGANTAFAVITNMSAGQHLNQWPLDLILPAVFLPVIFGAIAQVFSFRRTVSQLA